MGDTEEEKRKQRAQKRGFIIEEIIATEKTYFSRLCATLDVYVLPLRTNGVLDMADVQQQFGYWDVMVGIHKELYETMLKGKEAGNCQLGQIFLGFSAYLKIYQNYLVGFDSAISRRAALMTSNKDFVKFLEQAQQDPRAFGFAIETLLIEPVQRIPRYKMLLAELLKYTPDDHEDRPKIIQALEKVADVAMQNNEAIRQRENSEKLMEIMMSIMPAKRINLLDNPKRKLLRKGDLLRQCRREAKPFTFWLFTDKLLYGDTDPLSGMVNLHREINLIQCRVSAARAVENLDSAFTVESPSKSFIVWGK
jgi:hypothetical protein